MRFTKPARMKIAVCGPLVPIHAKTIASALGAELIQNNQNSTDADVVLFVFPTSDMIEFVDRCKRRGIYTVGYWIGNDVRREQRRDVFTPKLPTFDLNLACHDRLVKDLEDLRIKSERLYFFTPNAEMMKAPTWELPLAAVYMPSIRGKHNFEKLCAIAEATKEIDFAFYGNNDLPLLPGNVEDFGRLTQIEVAELMRNCSVLLRLTEHDGFPQNIIEAKMAKKTVISNYNYQACWMVRDTEEAVKLLKDPKNHLPDETSWPDWYRKNCSSWSFDFRFRDLMGEHAGLSR